MVLKVAEGRLILILFIACFANTVDSAFGLIDVFARTALVFSQEELLELNVEVFTAEGSFCVISFELQAKQPYN